MADKVYKYGAPDKYGDFPYLYQNKYTKEQQAELIKERCPESYDMQLVEQAEVTVLRACVNQGIDSHLEAATMTREATVQDRKLPDGLVFARHLDAGFDPAGLACLIRRLEEFEATDDLIEEAKAVLDESDIEESYGDTLEEKIGDRLWEYADDLRRSILETLQIEAKDI